MQVSNLIEEGNLTRVEKGESRIDKEFAFPLLENMARMASKGHH